MIKGWDHFIRFPRWVKADKIFWVRDGNKKIDQVVSIILALCKEMLCVVCGDKESPNFKSYAGLTIHLKYHRARTIQYWLDNIITKSPKQLQEMICQ